MIHRRLTANETDLVRSVFGGQINADQARLAFHPGGGWAVTLGPLILFPRSAALIDDFSAAPNNLSAWFVHEMAHVWQYRHRPLWTLWSWFSTLISGGYGPRRRAYRYSANPDWSRLNLEQQAQIVADAFALGLFSSPSVRQDAFERCLRDAGLRPQNRPSQEP